MERTKRQAIIKELFDRIGREKLSGTELQYLQDLIKEDARD